MPEGSVAVLRFVKLLSSRLDSTTAGARRRRARSMDRFVTKRSAFAPPAKRKPAVSIADMMRANGKKTPLGEDNTLMGGLGAAKLAALGAASKRGKAAAAKAAASLTDEQRRVVECARAGRSVFFTGNAVRRRRPPSRRIAARVEKRAPPHALSGARTSARRDQFGERERCRRGQNGRARASARGAAAPPP